MIAFTQPSQPQSTDGLADLLRHCDLLPLLPEDQLHFRLAVSFQCSAAHSPPDETQGADIATVFRRGFQKVWNKIPRADRQRLSTYWQECEYWKSACPDDFVKISQAPKPLIQIVQSESPDHTPQHLGHH